MEFGVLTYLGISGFVFSIVVDGRDPLYSSSYSGL